MSKLSYLSEFQNHLLRPPHYFALHVNFFYYGRHFTEFFLDALQVTPGGFGLLTRQLNSKSGRAFPTVQMPAGVTHCECS